MNELRFDGRVALITGAARGLGRAYAEQLAARGASVVINDIDDAEATATANAIAGAVSCAADIATKHGALAAVQTAIDTFGHLDIVVANAGTSWHRPFADITTDEMRGVLESSLFGTFEVVHAAWPHFVAQHRGRIVTTSSGAVFGFAGRAHYAAAKGAVLGLTNTMALEGAKHGIHANTVMPWGATRLSRPGGGAPDANQAAAPVAWLCHDDCNENGAVFTVGGGRIARVTFAAGREHEVTPDTIEAYRDVL